MTKEYDVYKKRITLLIQEETIRKGEILAKLSGSTLTKTLSTLLHNIVEEQGIELTPEDELIVNERVAENLRKRIEARNGN